MQQRRLRPGDVLDDYCPRERRITDHAIVAMIEDDIKQTRCVSCDTEHEYKQARIPPQRRKKAPPALFTQVLDGLQGPARLAQGGTGAPPGEEFDGETDETSAPPAPPAAPAPPPAERIARGLRLPDEEPAAATPPSAPTPAPTPESSDEEERVQEEGPVRRPLIRAQLPRHEGQQPPARELPDFTIRQPTNGRGSNRPGGHSGRPGGGAGRRRPGGGQGPSSGQTRFGGGQGRGNQFGRSGERRQGAGHGHGQGQGQGHGHGHGQGQGQGRGGRPNRGGGRRGGGGKKH